MARRAVGDFDRLLDAWAAWCERGRPVLAGAGHSLLARWMDSRGHIVFGGSAPAGGGVMACIEGEVEQAVAVLFAANPLAADVLRLEYAAGCDEVARRRQLGRYEPRGMRQIDIALRLGVSVRTYRRALAVAREHVQGRLTGGKV